MIFKLFICILSVGFFLSCNPAEKKELPKYFFYDSLNKSQRKISWNELRSNDELHGRFIEIQGFFYYEFENVAIYPSNSSNSNVALWVELNSLNENDESVLNNFNGRVVSVIGRLDYKKKGHFGRYLGSIDSVFCIKTQ